MSKIKFLKVTNRILASILLLIGFSACKKYGMVEYGTPHADFVVSGKVTDSRGIGLEGIRVTIPYVDHHQRATSGFYPDKPVITQPVNDTLFSKENGTFEYKYQGFPTNDSINVKLKFEDISSNTAFETDSAKVTFFSSELKGGDNRWYSGKVTKEVTVQLKEK